MTVTRVAALIGVGAALVLGCARVKETEGKGGGEGKGGVQAKGTGDEAEVWGRFDFGEVTQGAVLEHEFEIENRTANAVGLGGVMAVHGCSARVGKGRLEVGEKGMLRVRCETASAGALRLRLPIVLEPGVGRAPELEVIANVTPRLAFGTKLVELEMPFGETRTQEVDLTGALAQRAELKLVEAPENTLFELGISPKSAGRAQRVKVTCKGKPVGVHTGNLTFATQLDEPREILLPYSCKVRGTLSVEPTNPYVNLRVSGDKFVDVEVGSAAPGFAVRAVEIGDGPFTARLEPGSQPARFRIRVSVIEARLPDEARSATGTLRILSNDPAEPRKEIPLFAFGRLNR